MREEQARLAREEEQRRLEQEEKREADREARLARILREQMEDMEKKKKEGSADLSKKNWDRIDPPPKEGDKSEVGESSDSKKRDQDTMAGDSANQQHGIGRPRVENAASPLDAGLLMMDIDTVRRAQEAQAAMFHQMLTCLEAIRQQGAGSAPTVATSSQDPAVAAGVQPGANPPAPPTYQHAHPPPPAQAPAPVPTEPPTPQPTNPPPPPPPAQMPETPAPTRPVPSHNVPATEPGRSGVDGTPSGGGFSARLAGMFASVAGNGTRRRTSGISINEPNSQGLGFDRINCGKKAADAGPGKEGKKKYVEDLTEVLFNKTKHELDELCKKDKIKYVNKKITSAALARLRGIEASGEGSEEDESEEDSQEENPS
ncbi:hypothetical protein CBR_g11135 [Chara braunii]|uniref:Uncharacterized protein n=1 Tax=Chara braunii TaxID=69332 RepID=A0A388KQJ6_CHABU|nr:hypothetical protein CBR_g11135 [Chara braunii]|eukprot:GBG72203.1 hypothetical protein CBR_g11135 [Chara braunii]